MWCHDGKCQCGGVHGLSTALAGERRDDETFNGASAVADDGHSSTWHVVRSLAAWCVMVEPCAGREVEWQTASCFHKGVQERFIALSSLSRGKLVGQDGLHATFEAVDVVVHDCKWGGGGRWRGRGGRLALQSRLVVAGVLERVLSGMSLRASERSWQSSMTGGRKSGDTIASGTVRAGTRGCPRRQGRSPKRGRERFLRSSVAVAAIVACRRGKMNGCPWAQGR